MGNNNFAKLGLGEDILKAAAKMGFEEPTAIQEKAVPVVLAGSDLIAQAQTGTGKTAAFGMPVIDTIETGEAYPQVLVMAPTRELAVQVTEELNSIGAYRRIKAVPVYGGQRIEAQINALKKRPHIIVATPGRLIDHMKRKTIKLSEIKVVILDEADEMLKMGFREDIEKILGAVPEERQTLLFSATVPRELREIAGKFLDEPESIKVESKTLTVENISQMHYVVKEAEKFESLCLLLDGYHQGSTIVFTRTKKRADELGKALKRRGYRANGLHGDMNQAGRERVLNSFRRNSTEILVATDVAARGLDIDNVTLIVNFDIPQDTESYVHRIGRTGRAGKTGIALTLMSKRDYPMLKNIEYYTKQRIERAYLPDAASAGNGSGNKIVKDLEAVEEKGVSREMKDLAVKLLAEKDGAEVLAAALQLWKNETDFSWHDETDTMRRKSYSGGRKPGGRSSDKSRRPSPRKSEGTGKKPVRRKTEQGSRDKTGKKPYQERTSGKSSGTGAGGHKSDSAANGSRSFGGYSNGF